MRRWVIPLLFGFLLSKPAFAEASPLNLDDEHLYLRQEQELLSVHGRGSRHWGWRRPPVHSWIQYQTVITKGEIPISSERFLELIARSKANQPLVAHIAAEERARFDWGVRTLGAFAVFGVGLGFSDSSDIKKSSLSNGIALAGLCGALLSGLVWTEHCSRPLFTIEEAAEAIKAYNRLLDQQT